MMRLLLWRGMLAGAVGALVAATFARLCVEPAMDAAVGWEALRHAHGLADDEVVSRATQRGLGLYTAVLLYGTAFGGLLAIALAAAQGRFGRLRPHALALLLGLGAFLVVALVPALKYPPNPPAVGLHDTVRWRTEAWFAMLAGSAAAALAAAWAWRRAARWTMPDRALAAGAAFVAVALLAAGLLPAVDEVPVGFPGSLLWRFRLLSLATQGLFWLVAADLFGRLAERLFARAGQLP